MASSSASESLSIKRPGTQLAISRLPKAGTYLPGCCLCPYSTYAFVIVKAFYPLLLIVSYEFGVHHNKKSLLTSPFYFEHSWEYYIYSTPTLYGAIQPFAIRIVTTVLAYLLNQFLAPFSCPVTRSKCIYVHSSQFR